jgi:hypothetical protein
MVPGLYGLACVLPMVLHLEEGQLFHAKKGPFFRAPACRALPDGMQHASNRQPANVTREGCSLVQTSL